MNDDEIRRTYRAGRCIALSAPLPGGATLALGVLWWDDRSEESGPLPSAAPAQRELPLLASVGRRASAPPSVAQPVGRPHHDDEATTPGVRAS